MEFTLEGLRELQRLIEVKAEKIVGNIDQKLQEECYAIQYEVMQRMSGKDAVLAKFVTVDAANKTVYLKFDTGERTKGGKVKGTARDYHNPASPKFSHQPFQQALEALGYTDIEPAYGASIPVSHGEAPGIRLKAKMGPDVIRRLIR